jgi:glutamate--cysteine ligase catalytic subunit
MDDLLATHFAHLFIRDPIVIFAEDLKELDLSKADHFENLQSTNWQHMRFKPPPPNSDMGWRVEFRPMEIQITDFENAAFAIFIVLVTRAILSFDVNFYIPIERVSENMQIAHKRDAVLKEKFWFRKNWFSAPPIRPPVAVNGNGMSSESSSRAVTPPLVAVQDEYALMSIEEIVNGPNDADTDEEHFPGLIPLVESYLESMNVDIETRCVLATYLDFIRKRADGRIETSARWIRKFIDRHPEYKHDSVVSDGIQYDLIQEVLKMERGE